MNDTLQKNETCYFLALDFDKESWRKDALAFYKTCEEFNLPAALERSQSGNSVHVWIFSRNLFQLVSHRSLGVFIVYQSY